MEPGVGNVDPKVGDEAWNGKCPRCGTVVCEGFHEARTYSLVPAQVGELGIGFVTDITFEGLHGSVNVLVLL